MGSCATNKKVATASQISQSKSTGGDGSSYEKAIVIAEKTETTGVDAEYAWLRKNYPGYKVEMQSLNQHDGKPYDILKIKTADGVEMSVYFDISNYFSKF